MKAILTIDFFHDETIDEDVLNDEIERIAAMVADGYTSGEVVGTEDTSNGWWTLTQAES